MRIIKTKSYEEMSKKAKRVVSMGMAAALALSALPLSGLSAVAAGTD